MFIFQLNDGTYYRESGTKYINSRKLHNYFSTFMDVTEDLEFFTKDINEAKLFRSKQAVRSSNAYSWGGTIHEVNVTISLKSK